MKKTAFLTVILADGAAPSHEIPLSVLRMADRLIACDGAWKTALALGCKVDAVVGDCDSMEDGDAEKLAQMGVPVIRDVEQDTNDLCKAFRYSVNSGVEGDIVILGAVGKREDHAIGNIFHLTEFAVSCPKVVMMTDNGVFSVVQPPGESFSCQEGAPVSVFAPFPFTAMESDGLEWPLAGVKFDSLWRGTLNRTVSRNFSLRTDKPVILYRPHQQRQS